MRMASQKRVGIRLRVASRDPPFHRTVFELGANKNPVIFLEIFEVFDGVTQGFLNE
jgi:hypothetical protein